MQLDELIESLKQTTGAIQSGFEKPDDDWLTVAAWHDAEEERGVIAPLMFSNEAEKNLMLAKVSEVIRACDSDMAAIVMSAWAATISPEQAAEIEKRGDDWPQASKSPLRTEMLLIMGKERGEPIVGIWSEIKRYNDKPPTLGEWETFSDTPPSGLFPDLLNAVD